MTRSFIRLWPLKTVYTIVPWLIAVRLVVGKCMWVNKQPVSFGWLKKVRHFVFFLGEAGHGDKTGMRNDVISRSWPHCLQIWRIVEWRNV